jgi:biotin carboxylase
MRKLLILGSDFGTIQVVREAHKLGLYVIVADLMKTSPTKELADEAWLLSSTDTDTLVQRCKEEEITALMFGASDFNVWNAREVCKRLNLPIYCTSDYACRVARDKGEFKRICQMVGAPIATGYHLTDALTDEEIEKVQYPVVVKPVDKSGNRGMSYCDNREELIAGYRAAREISDKEIIVERQLHGKEYNVHYVLADGHARLLYFSSTHHEPGEAENLYSFKCTTSCHLKQYIEEVNDFAIKVIEKAECKEGIVWFDCIRDDDGHFYFLEMGYRFGGVMTYVPYEMVTGFNTVRWMLECALGVKHTEQDLPPALDRALSSYAASYNLFSKHDGEIVRIEGLQEIEKMPGVFLDIPKREGNTVRLNACIGLLGIYGEDIEEICSRLQKVNSLLKTINADGENMFIYFDDFDSLRQEYYRGLAEFKS